MKQSELATILNITRQRVHQILKAGTISKANHDKWMDAITGHEGPVVDAVRSLKPVQDAPKESKIPRKSPKPRDNAYAESINILAQALNIKPRRVRNLLNAQQDYGWRIRIMREVAQKHPLSSQVIAKIQSMSPTQPLPTRGHRRVRNSGRWVKALSQEQGITPEAIYGWLTTKPVPEHRVTSVTTFAITHRLTDPDLWRALNSPCPFTQE